MAERSKVNTHGDGAMRAVPCLDGGLVESPAAGVELPARKLDSPLMESPRVYADWLNPGSVARYSDLDLKLMEPFHD